MEPPVTLEVLEELEFWYPETPGCSYSVPAGWRLAAGEACCISGVSGLGKSTAMTLLAALRRPRHGRLRYHLDGNSPHDVAPDLWEEAVGPALWRHLGFAFQRPELLRALTVGDNLRLVTPSAGGAEAPPLFTSEEWQAIESRRVWEISGGQTQRLGLLRAFGEDQRLVFLDEPTNNLDVSNRDAVAQFVRQQRAHRALVVVSHDETFLASLGIDHRFEITASRGEDGRERRLLARALSS